MWSHRCILGHDLSSHRALGWPNRHSQIPEPHVDCLVYILGVLFMYKDYVADDSIRKEFPACRKLQNIHNRKLCQWKFPSHTGKPGRMAMHGDVSTGLGPLRAELDAPKALFPHTHHKITQTWFVMGRMQGEITCKDVCFTLLQLPAVPLLLPGLPHNPAPQVRCISSFTAWLGGGMVFETVYLLILSCWYLPCIASLGHSVQSQTMVDAMAATELGGFETGLDKFIEDKTISAHYDCILPSVLEVVCLWISVAGEHN